MLNQANFAVICSLPRHAVQENDDLGCGNMSEPEQQRRRRGSWTEVVWLEANAIDEATFARVKAGAWLHIDPVSD